MNFSNFMNGVKILTVLKLSWLNSTAQVSPRNYHAFSFRIHGNARYKVNKKEVTVQDNDILFVPQNCGYYIDAEQEDLYVIHFKLLLDEQYDFEIFQPNDIIRAQHLFKYCYEVWSKKEPDYYFRTLSTFYSIMSLITLTITNRDMEITPITTAMNYLHNHFTDPDLSVLTLCDIAQLSDTWFRKLFIKYYHTTPRKYINSMRINYAKELLRSHYYNVEEVAEMSGFENAKYFSLLFKQFTGYSPSEYKYL